MIRRVSQDNSEISSAWHVEVLIIFPHLFSQVAVVLMSRAFGLNRDGMITFLQPTFGTMLTQSLRITLWPNQQTRERYFFTVLVLARFSLSIKRRSEAEHLERTIPISDSFLRSIAASAAPSRSLVKDKKEKLPKERGATYLTQPYHVYLIARWARTFCSGITLETYFLASYLLLSFMQTSTKG